MADDEQKPDINVPPEHVNIKVVSQDGNEIQFKIKRSAQLRKLIKAYCERQGHPQDSVAFLYDGNRVQETDTPESLDMEENDNQIDVMFSQTGGCS